MRENQGKKYLLLQAEGKGMIKAPIVQTNKVQFHVGIEPIDMLVDTGASISAVSKGILDRTWPNWQVEATPVKQSFVLRDVQGRKFTPEKTIHMTVSLQGMDFDVQCVVLRDLPTGVLLGMPFMMSHGVRLICERDSEEREGGIEISTIEIEPKEAPQCEVQVGMDGAMYSPGERF